MARTPDRRTQILLEAAQIFRDHGYQGTSMNLIAERLEMTKPGLYYHFKSKQELLFAIMDYALDLLEKDALAATMSATSSEERLRNIIFRHARLITREYEGALTVLVVDEANALTPEDRRVVTQRKRTYFEIVRATVEQLAKEDKLRLGIDTTVASFGVLGMVLWIAKWYRADGALSGDQIAEQVAELAISAILGDDRREVGRSVPDVALAEA